MARRFIFREVECDLVAITGKPEPTWSESSEKPSLCLSMPKQSHAEVQRERADWVEHQATLKTKTVQTFAKMKYTMVITVLGID